MEVVWPHVLTLERIQAVAEECMLSGMSCYMSPVATQIWNSTVANAGIFTDGFLRHAECSCGSIIWSSCTCPATKPMPCCRNVSNRMDIDDKKMDDIVFPTQHLQHLILRVSKGSIAILQLVAEMLKISSLGCCLQQALSPDDVLVVLFIAARWLQEGLTSHDLLHACANGSLAYFPTFHEACFDAEEELDGYPLREILMPKGTMNGVLHTDRNLLAS